MKKKKKLIDLIPYVAKVAPGVNYDVFWVKKFGDDRKQLGETRQGINTQQIILKLNEKDQETLSTYIHEMIHVFDLEYDVGLTERQVLKLEKAMFIYGMHNKLFDKLLKK